MLCPQGGQAKSADEDEKMDDGALDNCTQNIIYVRPPIIMLNSDTTSFSKQNTLHDLSHEYILSRIRNFFQ